MILQVAVYFDTPDLLQNCDGCAALPVPTYSKHRASMLSSPQATPAPLGIFLKSHHNASGRNLMMQTSISQLFCTWLFDTCTCISKQFHIAHGNRFVTTCWIGSSLTFFLFFWKHFESESDNNSFMSQSILNNVLAQIASLSRFHQIDLHTPPWCSFSSSFLISMQVSQHTFPIRPNPV